MQYGPTSSSRIKDRAYLQFRLNDSGVVYSTSTTVCLSVQTSIQVIKSWPAREEETLRVIIINWQVIRRQSQILLLFASNFPLGAVYRVKHSRRQRSSSTSPAAADCHSFKHSTLLKNNFTTALFKTQTATTKTTPKHWLIIPHPHNPPASFLPAEDSFGGEALSILIIPSFLLWPVNCVAYFPSSAKERPRTQEMWKVTNWNFLWRGIPPPHQSTHPPSHQNSSTMKTGKE